MGKSTKIVNVQTDRTTLSAMLAACDTRADRDTVAAWDAAHRAHSLLREHAGADGDEGEDRDSAAKSFAEAIDCLDLCVLAILRRRIAREPATLAGR